MNLIDLDCDDNDYQSNARTPSRRSSINPRLFTQLDDAPPGTRTPSVIDGPTNQDVLPDKNGPTNDPRWWSMSLVLKNTGSVARDHLASERTFLAWLRTSVSLAMAGVGTYQTRRSFYQVRIAYASPLHLAVAQLFRLSRTSRPPLQLPRDISIDPTSINAEAQLRLLETLDAYYAALTRDFESAERDRRFGKPLGGLLIVAGMVTLIIGTLRKTLVDWPRARIPQTRADLHYHCSASSLQGCIDTSSLNTS